MEHAIDWGSAEVERGELRVRLDHDPDFAFLEAFNMVLIESPPGKAASWGDVQFASGRIVVRDVQKGSGAPLREFLDRVVREADARRDDERENEFRQRI
jgi:hypothetical protein